MRVSFQIPLYIAGLVLEVGKFFFFVLILLLTTLVAASVGFFYGSLLKEFALANLAMAMTFVVMMVSLTLLHVEVFLLSATVNSVPKTNPNIHRM